MRRGLDICPDTHPHVQITIRTLSRTILESILDIYWIPSGWRSGYVIKNSKNFKKNSEIGDEAWIYVRTHIRMSK
jgi:hypothetical protein